MLSESGAPIMAAQSRSGGDAAAEASPVPGRGALAAATARPMATASSAPSAEFAVQRGIRLQTALVANVVAAIAHPSDGISGARPSKTSPSGVPSVKDSSIRPPKLRERAQARHEMSSAADTASASTGD